MDNDVISLITLLLERPFITLHEVINESSSTRRQVLYRLEKVNTLLQQEKLTVIRLLPTNLFNVDETSKQFLRQFILEKKDIQVYYFNKHERQVYGFLMLFIETDYLPLSFFMEALGVGRSSALQDLKGLAVVLSGYGIELKNNRTRGYYLDGSEMSIRRYMMREVILSISDEHNTRVFDLFIEKFRLATYDYSKLVTFELAKKHGIVFVEDRLLEFIYIFILLHTRICNTQLSAINHAEIRDIPVITLLNDSKEHEFTLELIQYYKNTELINDNEVKYISAWVLGISVGNVEENTDDCVVIAEIVGKIMSRFELLSGIHYKDTEEIFRQLYSHFRPAYYRLLYRLPINNPLSDKVKEEYKDLFAMVRETMKPFSVLFNEEVPDDELSYLTMHFASIYTRNREGELYHKTKALIICTNGIGTSAILFNELNSMFPEIEFLAPIEIGEFDVDRYHVDLIFTTQLLRFTFTTSTPIIRVSPIMDVYERFEVEKEVYSYIGSPLHQPSNIDVLLKVIERNAVIQNRKNLITDLQSAFTQFKDTSSFDQQKEHQLELVDMISIDSIQLNVEVKSTQEALYQSGQVLVKNLAVTESYLDKIVHSSENILPDFVIAPHIALPHTLPKYGALKYAIAITTLKTPVNFKNSSNHSVFKCSEQCSSSGCDVFTA